MNFPIILGILICLVSFGDTAQASNPDTLTQTTVPWGAGFLINGFMGEEEWDTPNAAEADLGNGVLAYFSQDSLYIYIAIRSLDTVHTGIDLYIKSKHSCILMLHVSSALAERTRCDSVWSETIFGQNRSWTANVIPFYIESGNQRVLAPAIFEFQFNKSIVLSRSLFMMVHFKRPEKIAPPSADPALPETWFSITL